MSRKSSDFYEVVKTYFTKKVASFSKLIYRAKTTNYSIPIICVSGGFAMYMAYKYEKLKSVYSSVPREQISATVKLTAKEKRFIRFASVEYGGQLYMTPQNFLESVIEADPKPRYKRKILTDAKREKIKKRTPKIDQGSKHLFRQIGNKGIISFAEYIFLISVVTRPESGFRIAFDLFDTNFNKTIDKNEYLILERIISRAWRDKERRKKTVTQDRKRKHRRIKKGPLNQYKYEDDKQGLQGPHLIDTTLIMHFFGPEGKNEVTYHDFKEFVLNLQTEILEVEFTAFAKGLPTISEIDFARILLRYTNLTEDEHEAYLDRLLDKIEDPVGITFDEFHLFCQFLKNLEDFAIMMRVYFLENYKISKKQFERAVKVSMGTTMSPHLINTIFAIFDSNGDGFLAPLEFVTIMKDRLHRGFKSSAKNKGWKAYRRCIKQQKLMR